MEAAMHTPTPWYFGEMYGWGELCITRRPEAEYGPSGAIGDAPIAVMVEKAAHWSNGYPVDANAAFIVKAVNSHYQLVAALQEMMQYAGIIEERCDSVATDAARKALDAVGAEYPK